MSGITFGIPRKFPLSRAAIVAVASAAWVMLFSAHRLHENAVSVAWLTWAWALMTAAMMLPSTLPMVAAFSRVAGQLDRRGIGRSTATFVVGYVTLWIGFSVLCATAQATLASLALLDDAMRFSPPVLSGALLICGGLFQLSEFKHVCLRTCRSPLGFILDHYRPGPQAAFELGVRHGAFCIGCCWLLMLLVWVGGMMNVLWMIVLSGLVIAEKVLPRGALIAKVSGVFLAGFGSLLIVTGWESSVFYLDLVASICRHAV